MRRILLANYGAITPGFGTEYRSHLLAEAWAAQGIEVRYLAASFSHLSSKPPPPTKVELEVSEGGVDYRLVPVRHYSGSGPARVMAILDTWRKGGQALVRHAREFKPDLVVAATVYQLDNWGMVQAARECGAVAMRETRDLWPLTIKNFSRTWPLNPLVPLIQAGEDHACRHADVLVCTMANALEYLSTRGLTQERFAYIPQIGPKKLSPEPLPEEVERSLAEMKSQAETLLVFTGGFVPSNNVDQILRALALAGKGFRLALFGSGSLEPSLKSLAQELGGQARFFGHVPRRAIPSALKFADAGVHCFGKYDIYRYGVSPNKVVEYLSFGLPCIMAVPGSSNMVAESGAGLTVPAGDVNQLASAFQRFASLSPEARDEMARKGREYVSQNCSVEIIARRTLEAAEAARARRAK